MGYKGYPFSETTYRRRKKRAEELGCDIMDVPDSRGKGVHAKGRQCGRWNDGRMVTKDGYVKIRVGKSHLLADPNGYAYEHSVVWASARRSHVFGDEVLHHKNGDRTDNRLENLKKMTRAEHNRFHAPPRDPKTGRFMPRVRKNVPDEWYDPNEMVEAAGRLLDGKLWDEYPESY